MGYLIVDVYFIIGLDGESILFYHELMIKYTGKNIINKKDEEKKIKDMNSFAKKQFYALTKKHIGISIQLYNL